MTLTDQTERLTLLGLAPWVVQLPDGSVRSCATLEEAERVMDEYENQAACGVSAPWLRSAMKMTQSRDGLRG